MRIAGVHPASGVVREHATVRVPETALAASKLRAGSPIASQRESLLSTPSSLRVEAGLHDPANLREPSRPL